MSAQQIAWLKELARNPSLGLGPRTAIKRCLKEHAELLAACENSLYLANLGRAANIKNLAAAIKFATGKQA